MNEIFHRTSIRKYQTKPVEDDKIEKILQAAMAAPSAGNQQPWEFYVVKDKTTLDKLSILTQLQFVINSGTINGTALYQNGTIL